MSEWWTYGLSDFLMFSPATYRRMFELHNAAVWPLHVVTLAIGIALLVDLVRPGRTPSRLIMVALAALWAWVAWSFQLRRYAAINWAAVYFAAAFAVQAMLLAVFAMRTPAARADRFGRVTAAAVMSVALAYPAIGVVAGRTWTPSEVFGIAPDPTALATLAVLALREGRAAWLLRAIPIAWCAMSGAAAWTMHAPDAWVLPGAAFVALTPPVRVALTRSVRTAR